MAEEMIFTKHAVLKLRQRNIDKELVIKAIKEPDSISLGYLKHYVYKKFGRRYLKVVFKKIDNVVLIITQHWVRKI